MGDGAKPRRSRPLVVRYIALMTAVAVVLVALFGWMSYQEQSRHME